MTKARRRRIHTACNGRCKCGVEVPMAGTVIDHRVSLFMGGKDEDANLEYLCAACDYKKTHTQDAPARAKTKRLIKKADPETRKKPRMKSRPFPASTRKIMSRPFPSRKSRP
jgi:5-methylcytosine-specific restriction endonuclease McrA